MPHEKEGHDGGGPLLLREVPLPSSRGREEEHIGELADFLDCNFGGCKSGHNWSWYARCQIGRTEFHLLSENIFSQ